MIVTADLATATPVEIDTQIAHLQDEVAQHQAAISCARREIARIEQLIADGDSWQVTVETRHSLDRQHDQLHESTERLDAAYVALRPLYTEFHRRGGWTRYYLVDSHDGHVHSSTGCSSCYPTTRYYWLISESGKTAEQVVAEAQDQACTVCFPWAPVTGKRGTYRTPSQAEAEQRAAEKAALAEAKKAAEITAPDGGELYAAEYVWRKGQPITSEFRSGDRLHTEVSAWRRAMGDAGDLAWYGDDHPDAPKLIETVNRCVAALAARRGVTEESLRAELDRKIAAKAKRDQWTVKWLASSQH